MYFYAAERHRRPHLDVPRCGEHATLNVVTGEVLAGELPPRLLRERSKLYWRSTLSSAPMHFTEALAHRFPGSLEAGTEATDD